jgi:2-polyprenyl-3-methyl-5-hydroxy-6-metoxy-1,4-benzoquinol methylase
MNKVSVDLSAPSPYIERDGKLHRFKRRLTYGFAFRLIRKHFGPAGPKSVLEIGTGAGFFMDFFTETYPGATATGIEYDERLLAETRRRAPRANCMQGNAETFDLQPQLFDLIVSFQVIEHLYEPERLVINARRHLAPGGVMILTTPNLGGLGARVMKSRWHAYRDDHVSLKTVDQWTSLIEAQGFRTVYSGSTFFSGIPWLNRMPLGLINWSLLTAFGAWQWRQGESFVGAFVPVQS